MESLSSKHSTSTSRLQRSLSKLESELHSRRRAIEETALRVLSYGRVAEFEEPDQYSKIRAREMAALAESSRIEQARCLRTLRRAKKSRLGTQKRLNTLKSFIYGTEHYLLPVLERISPDSYKSTINKVIIDGVNEYSNWVNDFDEYIAKSILKIIARAEKLRIPAPQQVRAKCEKAFSMTTNKFFELFEGLSETFWDDELKNRVIGTFGDRSLSDTTFYDSLLMTISKIPESRLKRMIERRDPTATLEVSGERLLHIAHEKGLFGTKADSNPTFFVVKGYLGAIRNEPHHVFITPGFQRVVNSMLFTNQVLKLIDAESERTLTRPSDVSSI